MAEEYCYDCRSLVSVVYDHQSGETICSECGHVLDSHPVGDSSNLPPNNPNDGSGSSENQETPLERALKIIEHVTDSLDVNEGVKHYATELYQRIEEERICGRQRNPQVIMAACVYLGCQEEGCTRTFREIFNFLDGAKMREIHRTMETLKRHLEVDTRTIHASDLAFRYCSQLGLNHHIVRAVHETLLGSKEIDLRRNSTSILAAAIFMVTQLSDHKMSLREIAVGSEVTEGTLKKAYRDLYPHALALIPNWFASEEDVKRLCVL